jgi:hypothetical protein
MAEHVWTVLCQKTLLDPQTNVVSLIDVLEKITLAGGVADVEEALAKAHNKGSKGLVFPVFMQLVTWWTRSDYAKPEELDIRVAILDPSGERLFSQEVPIDLTDSNARRMTLRFQEFQMTQDGVYWFWVEKKKAFKDKTTRWTIVTKLPLEVTSAPTALS